MGKLVERVQVFGVVAAMPHPDASKLLKLTWILEMVGAVFRFVIQNIAVNMILHHLHLG